MRLLPDLGSEEEKIKLVNLDLKDKKILRLLSENVRMPLSVIAKKAALSRDAVAYRIKRLENQKVIVGARVVLDTAKLGYNAYHLLLRLTNPVKEVEQQIIQKLRDLPQVRAILKFSGSYDLEIAVIAKNIEEFDALLTEIIQKTEKYLEDYEILVVTKQLIGQTLPKKFLTESKPKNLYFHKKSISHNNPPDNLDNDLDKKDLEIIKLLRDNAKLSLLEISSKIKVSADTVAYRLQKLKQQKIISGFVPVINYASLGYRITALMSQISNLDAEKEKKLHFFLENNEHILWAVKCVGKYNLLTYICTAKEEELHQTINALRTLFPEQIKSYNTLLAFVEYKYTYAPDILFEKG